MSAERRRRVVLFHWNEVEGRERVVRLRTTGFDAVLHHAPSGTALREMREDLPAALVIDLARMPSHGRQVAAWARQQKWARAIPLVFVDGERDKVAALRAMLPDAAFTTWNEIGPALRAAIARPPVAPVVPSSIGGYSGTPLPKKLGIKPGSTVVLVGAPTTFAATLGELPEGARLAKTAKDGAERVLLFVRSRAELARRFASATEMLADGGSIWIAWPKQSSPLAGDVKEPDVRAFGLARSFVDYKVCAIDGDWSGLCFARRKAR